MINTTNPNKNTIKNDDTIKILNDVLELLHDSKKGYEECSDKISNSNLKKIFDELSKTREEMITSLESEIRNCGGEPEKTGSVTGALHRLFVDLKSLVTGGDNEAIINEIKRGEGTLITHYQDAIAESLPPHIKNLLTDQLNQIKRSLEKIGASKEKNAA